MKKITTNNFKIILYSLFLFLSVIKTYNEINYVKFLVAVHFIVEGDAGFSSAYYFFIQFITSFLVFVLALILLKRIKFNNKKLKFIFYLLFIEYPSFLLLILIQTISNYAFDLEFVFCLISFLGTLILFINGIIIFITLIKYMGNKIETLQ